MSRPTTAAEIRQAFLSYFAERDHRVVKSYALIPPDDPTLFFVNAGMVQFKDIFVGAKEVDYQRATSVQRCLRVSGKHNDLENVGRTPRHHTLFEMLGNFSFGDYFKERAITLAWGFLTDVLALDVSTLHVTVHPDDDDAFALWRDVIGIAPERLHRDPENFWSMGDTGPCGPCSEIHVDQGIAMSGGVEVPFGDPAGEHRYLEIWNLVFMQYDRAADGVMTPLPSPSIDTGAGLERLAAVLQGKTSNYDTTLFQTLMGRVAKGAGIRYGDDDESDTALRVIADHTRAAAFLIADGVYPDNEGRGYVLRRIMRRAIRFGRMIGLTDPFLIHSTAHVVEMMGDAYQELVDAKETIHRIVEQEETRFGRTINAGMKRLNEELETLKAENGAVLDGRIAFELYDTHGFPPDLTGLIASERGVSVDHEAFEAAMTEQRERARAASKFGTGDLSAYQALAEGGVKTTFVGYDREQSESPILAILVDGQRIPRAAPGQRVEVVVGETPFYAESGGQAGDTGTISTAGDEACVVRVEDTRRPFGDVVVHIGTVESGTLLEAASAILEIDVEGRDATRKNHSATHLLHHALHEVLGAHVRQRGSLVGPHRLRFDFSHTGAMTSEEMVQVDRLVNRLIQRNEAIETRLMSFDAAVESGATAFFEEKYGDEVRVLSVGSESTELCGGTHARATGDIGLFKLISEGAISSGVRRVEAVTGMDAVNWVQSRDTMLRATAEQLNVSPEQVTQRVEALIADRKALQGELATAQTAAQVARASSSLDQAKLVGEHKVLAVRLDGVPGRELRAIAETLRDKLGSGVLALAAVDGPKVSLLVAATSDVTKQVHSGKLVGQLASLVGGRGGGRPDMAQAGGSDASGVDAAIDAFYSEVTSALS
ncbi:MAG: alanine--tRNA ligase [Myxococcota bacterium]